MRKLILTALLALGLVVPTFADQWQNVIHKAEKAVVYIENEDGACTGFVINAEKKYVMTAAHCYGEKLWVDLVTARVVALDTKKDLMVLEVKDLDPSKESLVLASKNPEIRQDVMSVGFGYALERPQFRSAHVSDNAMVVDQGIGGPFIAVDVSFTPGQSGGPVVDANGDVVAIVQRGDGGTIGLGAGAELIKERMGRFFSAKK